MMCHNSLATYYRSVFALAQHHKYQISEIENLMPFERDLYLDMLADYLEEMKEKRNGK